MTFEEAQRVQIGDTVRYGGWQCAVVGIMRGEITGPHFRLAVLKPGREAIPVDGPTSYRLCQVERKDGAR